MKINNTNVNIKKLFIDGAAWSFIGFGLSQILRLASSIYLARLLSPDDYGLVAIVTVIYVGIALMSDLGIGTNILQSHRGEDEDFLNIAWSLQVVKGWIVWFVCILVSWPASVFYNQPILCPLIIVTSFSAVIVSYNSIGVYTAERRIDLKKQTMFQILSQVIGLIIMLIIANIHPTVWVLVIGGLASNLVYSFLSYKLVPFEHKFNWDKETIYSLIHFGKWILFSSILGFIVGHSSSLILGKFLTITSLGLYSIGVSLFRVVETIHSTITTKIIVPIYSKIKHLEIEQRKSHLIKLKLAMIGLFIPMILFLTLFASDIVGLLFDARYQEATWIFQIYSLAYIPMVVSSFGSFYLVMGDTKLLAKLTSIKTIVFIINIYIGWALNGGDGIILGLALSTSLNYFVDLYPQKIYGIWLPKIDALVFLTIGLLTVVAFYSSNRLDNLIRHIT